MLARSLGLPSLWCRAEPVASHHFADRCGVWRTAGCCLEDVGHIAEVPRAEDAGGDDREHLRVGLMIVVETVDDPATDAQHLARAYVGLLAVERPAQNSLEPVDRLLITVMAVCARHPGSGCDVELEDCDRTSRRLALQPESDRNPPDPNLFAWSRQHEHPFPRSFVCEALCCLAAGSWWCSYFSGFRWLAHPSYAYLCCCIGAAWRCELRRIPLPRTWVNKPSEFGAPEGSFTRLTPSATSTSCGRLGRALLTDLRSLPPLPAPFRRYGFPQ